MRSWFGFFIALFFLVLFSGCLDQKKSIAERQLCLELSSQAFATVPICATQQDCFAGVNAAFFGFDETVFSFSERQKLLEYKNQLALAWLYYNNALKNIQKVREVCFADSGYSGLARQVNELNFNLSKAFESVDAANKSAFGLMLLQQSELERQEVSLIKEEPVFDDLVLLSSNLNALQSNSVAGENLFVEKYFLLVSGFDALAKQHGFSRIVLNESSVFDLLGQNSGLIVKEFAGNSFFVPVLASAVSGAINSIIDSFKLSGSVSALKGFPAFDFALLFGNFVGTNASLANEFSLMQESIALHRLELLNRNSEISQKISSLIDSSEKKIAEIDSANYAGFDQNLLAGLYALLGQEQTIIASQRFSLAQISSLKEDAQQQLYELKTSFFELLQKDFFGELSFGKKTSGLKQILASIEELNTNIDFFSEETITGLETLCTERLSLIEEQIGTAVFPQDCPLQLFDLKAKTRYYASQFKDSIGSEKKLFYCRQAIESFNSFNKAMENFENYSVEIKASAKDCLFFLKNVFASESQLVSVFLPQYKQLSKLAENNALVEEITKSCLELKQELVSQLSQNETIKRTEKNFSSATNIVSELSELKQHYPEILAFLPLDSLSRKSESLREFFGSDSTIAFGRALPVLKELEKNSSSLLQEAIEEKRNALIAFFKHSAQTIAFPVETAFLGKPFNARVRVSFSSPFSSSFDFPLSFSIPFDAKNARLVNSSGNVLSARLDSNKLFIDLNSVCVGQTFLELDSNFSVIPRQSQSIVFLDSQKATIKHSLVFSTPFQVEKLFVELPIESSCTASNGLAFFEAKQLQVSIQEKKLFFSITQPKNNSTAEVYYDLAEPFSVSTKLLGSKQVDQNTFQYSFLVSVQNNLGFRVENARLQLPLPFEENNSIARLFDFSGNQKILHSESGKTFFSAEEILPNQRIEFSLLVETKNQQAYWNSFLQKTMQELLGLALSDNESIKNAANELLEKASAIEQSLAVIDSAKINELIQLEEETRKLLLKETVLQDSAKAFLSEKSVLEKLLAEKQKEFSAFNDLNLSSNAAALSLSISNARQLLAEAVSLAESQGFDAALKKIFEAENMLSKSKQNSLNEFILENRDSLLQNPLFKSNDFSDANSQKLRNEIFSLDSLLLKAVSENDSNALSLFKQMQAKSTDLNNAANSAVLRIVFETKKSIGSFKQLLSSKGISEKIDLLGKLFQTVSDSDLESANYVLPISRSFLEKTRLKTSELDSVRLEKRLTEFDSFFEKKDYFSAFNLIPFFKEELETKKSELESLDSSLSNALARLLEDATVAVNSAMDFAEQSSDKESLKQAKTAEKELEKKNFLKAIVLAKTIEGNAPTQQQTGFFSFSLPGIPLAIIPLLGIIAVALFVKSQREKKESQKLRLQKIFRNH